MVIPAITSHTASKITSLSGYALSPPSALFPILKCWDDRFGLDAHSPRLQRRSDVENVYSEAVSVSWTPALGAMRFGSGFWCDYVAYKTSAKLNVFYSTLCPTDPESGAVLKASMSEHGPFRTATWTSC